LCAGSGNCTERSPSAADGRPALSSVSMLSSTARSRFDVAVRSHPQSQAGAEEGAHGVPCVIDAQVFSSAQLHNAGERFVRRTRGTSAASHEAANVKCPTMQPCTPRRHLRGLEAQVCLRGGPSGPPGSSGPGRCVSDCGCLPQNRRLRLGSAWRIAGIAGSLEQFM